MRRRLMRFAHVDFRREARWLTVLCLLLPAVAVLGTIVVPWLARLLQP